MTRASSILAIGVTLALAGCGDDESSGGGPDSARPASTQAAGKPKASPGVPGKPGKIRPRRKGTSIKVMNSDYGKVIFNGKGRAIYLFTLEKGKTPRCYGDCATAWPPVLTKGAPQAGRGAKASLLGTTKRKDGKTQATYNGHPLYYYVSDREPGQILCQDVEEYGGHWYVVAPSGKAVT
jgi:predicted lipoprotein with Yx(FWY)xxD motif